MCFEIVKKKHESTLEYFFYGIFPLLIIITFEDIFLKDFLGISDKYVVTFSSFYSHDQSCSNFTCRILEERPHYTVRSCH